MVQIADVVGARGVTLLLAAANTALALAWLGRSNRRSAARLVAWVGAGVVLAAGYGVFRMRTLPTRTLGTVAAIQPAHDAEQRWNAAQLDSIAAELLNLSQRALVETRPDLVVWPEAAVPHVLTWHPDWVAAIAEQARGHRTPIVVGAIDYRSNPDRSYEYWNAAFVFDTAGRYNAQPVYHKNYLVPIVERVPFVNPRWFARLRWFGGYGRGEPGPAYQVPMGRFGVLICYESAFEDLSRRYRRLGAEFLVNITNDAWFGSTSAPYQHAAHLVMRAIETRSGIARAANTGISELVDPLGRGHRRTRLGDRTLVAGEVLTADVTTLYTRLGDWVGTLCLIGWLALIFTSLRLRARTLSPR
jgi:apolipoprotein N-acyltransferase